LQIEEFINGRMFHIDSLCINKEIKCSYITEYNTPPLNYDNNYIYGSLLVDYDSALYKDISQFNFNVIRSLSLANGCSHLEIFVTENNDIFFCEIGARFGGGSIIPMIKASSKNNLAQIWFLNELGVEKSLNYDILSYTIWINYNLLPNHKVNLISIPKKDWIIQKSSILCYKSAV
jgi:hypothetical protein